MPFEQRENSGSLFVNDRKTSPNHPDFKGSINVGGQDFWISAWKKTSKDGTKKYLSLSLSLKEGERVVRDRTDRPEHDDDIPF